MKFIPMTVAIYTGLITAGLHLLWSILIALGIGQVYLDWILGLHFIENPYIVKPFNFGTMVMLLLVTFVAGFVLGWVGTIFWNRMVKK